MSTAPLEEKPGPPATPRDAAREPMIMAIGRVFRRYGYEAASLSNLSRETGLGRSSLYHFFPGGKEDMAMAVLDLAERFVRDDLMRQLSTSGSRKAGVEVFVAELREYYEGGTLGCLYATLTLHDCPPEIGARVAALTEQWIGAIADYLIEHGDGAARTHAERIVRLIQGGLVVALATRDPRRFEASLDDIRPLLGGQT